VSVVDEVRPLADAAPFAKRAGSHFSCTGAAAYYIRPMTTAFDRPSTPTPIADAPLVAHARFRIGDVVRHRQYGFRGVVFDVDPVFANSEEWYEAIPEEVRPAREQPYYHLFAENDEGSYIAYVSQQNLDRDNAAAEPVNHPAIDHLFRREADGSYHMHGQRWH
jgi:heat shock protein HspQ